MDDVTGSGANVPEDSDASGRARGDKEQGRSQDLEKVHTLKEKKRLQDAREPLEGVVDALS